MREDDANRLYGKPPLTLRKPAHCHPERAKRVEGSRAVSTGGAFSWRRTGSFDSGLRPSLRMTYPARDPSIPAACAAHASRARECNSPRDCCMLRMTTWPGACRWWFDIEQTAMTENTVECAVCEAYPRPSRASIEQNAWSRNSHARFRARRLRIRPCFLPPVVWAGCFRKTSRPHLGKWRRPHSWSCPIQARLCCDGVRKRRSPMSVTWGFSVIQMVRVKGLEPSWGCPHTDLNRTRLPIPPHPHLLFAFRPRPEARKDNTGLTAPAQGRFWMTTKNGERAPPPRSAPVERAAFDCAARTLVLAAISTAVTKIF